MWSEPFYTPEYFDFWEEIVGFESEDPDVHAQAEQRLKEKSAAGNLDALLVLSRQYLAGKHQYINVEAGVLGYLELARKGRMEGLDHILRYFKEPEDTEIGRCIQRLKEEGYTPEKIKEEYRKHRQMAEE